MAADSQDLRARVVHGVTRGDGATSIARRLAVSPRGVDPVKHRYEPSGAHTPVPLGGYRRSRVAAMAATGATVRSLPPSSPDLHPIAHLFSTRNARLQKAAHRRMDALWNDIGTLLGAFSSAECAHDFKAAGYGV